VSTPGVTTIAAVGLKASGGFVTETAWSIDHRGRPGRRSRRGADRRRSSRVSTPVVTTGRQIRTVALPAWSIDNRGRRGHAAPGPSRRQPGQRHRGPWAWSSSRTSTWSSSSPPARRSAPPRPAWSIDNRGRRGHAAPGPSRRQPGQRHRGRPGQRSRRGAARRRSSRVSTPVVTTGPQIRTAAAVEANRSIIAGSPDLDEG